MDKDRDPNRIKDDLRRHMDETRRSMSETVGEIKDELSSALDWKTYVRRYPEVYLVGGVLAGIVVGRAVKGLTLPERPEYPEYQDRPAPERRAEPEEFISSGPAPSKPAEESPMRKMGEMLAAAVIAQVAPVLSAALRRALGIAPAPAEEPPSETRKPWLH